MSLDGIHLERHLRAREARARLDRSVAVVPAAAQQVRVEQRLELLAGQIERDRIEAAVQER